MYSHPWRVNRFVGSNGLPDSQAHQGHAEGNPSEESRRDDGLQAHRNIFFILHAGILILDHASSPGNGCVKSR
jgi:hypothetical protein